MRERLAHVLWLGGSPCAGKSSIADGLAARHGLTVYRCDDAFHHYKERIDPRAQPVFARLARATCDEIWLRPTEQQIREEIALYREEFPQILADLAAMPKDRPILAEGAALLPELVGGLGVPPHRAIWVVPTEPFQRACYGERAWRHEVLAECSDKAQAWERWMRRDAGFAREVAREAGGLGYRLVTVDGAWSVEDQILAVEAHFRGSLHQPGRDD